MTFPGRLRMMDRMFGPLGFQEVILILVVALLIFGPRKLPEIGRTIGRTLSEFRKASTELKRSINAEIADEELRQSDPRKLVRETVAEVKSLGKDLTSAPAPDEPAPAAEPKAEVAKPAAAAGAVSRSSVSAGESDPETSTS